MERPIGNVTFCFTDIEGSTALLNSLGNDRYERVLREHHELLRHAFKDCNGVEVNDTGDGLFFAWQSALDAALGCAAGQRALAGHDWPYGVVVRVRMGLHTGDASTTATGDYIGLAIHQAAHVGAAGHGGQVILSPATVTALSNSRPDRCAIETVGEFHVRDFAEAITLSRLTVEGLVDVEAPLRLPPATPRNFTAGLTSFVGRDDDTAALCDLVPQHRLVTVVGPGGVGKSRLAREVAARSTASFADGVWLVELEGADPPTPGTVAGMIAAAVGIGLAPGASPVDVVVDDLVERSRLLVLDACEGALDAVAQIVEHVAAKHGASRFLATSREALAVRTEQRWPLTPLALPEPTHPDVDTVASNGAAQLFADRARAVDPGFTIDHTSADDVAIVCRTLEGIPLAIELAAARLGEVPLDELATSVQRVLELRGGYRTDPARHRTMRALVEWSFESISPLQRVVYARLATLRGWSGRGAAVATGIAGNTPVTEEEAADAVDALVAKSILLVDDAGRVRMLDPVREHASEVLAASGEEDLVMATLLAWAFQQHRVRLVEAHSATGRVPEHELSYETCRALLHWGAVRDPVAMGQLVTTMQIEFVLGGRAAEGLEWVETALVSIGEEHTELRAALLHVGGSITATHGDKLGRDLAERGLIAAEAALEAARFGASAGAPAAIDPVTSLVGAANTLGASLLYERRLDEAEEMFARAAGAVEPRSRAMLVIHNNLASVFLARGDLAGAEDALRKAADIALESDDPNGPHVRFNIAALRGIAGDHAGAAAELEATIEQAKALGALQTLPMAITNLGIARRNLGDPRALETLRDGIRIGREQQNMVALAEGLKAMVDVTRHQPAEMRIAADDLAAVASRLQDDATSAWAAALTAVAAEATGDTAGARLARRLAVDIARGAPLPGANASLLLLELANSLINSAPERAANLFGAAEAVFPPGMPPQPTFQRLSDSVRTRLTDALGDRVDPLIAEGHSIDVESAIELATP